MCATLFLIRFFRWCHDVFYYWQTGVFRLYIYCINNKQPPCKCTQEMKMLSSFNGLKTTDKSNLILAIWPAPASPLIDAAVIWFTAVEPGACWSLRSYQIREKKITGWRKETGKCPLLPPQRGDEAVYSPRCRKFSSMPLQEFLVIKDFTRPHGCFLYFTSVYTLITWQSKIQLRRIKVKVRLTDNMVNYTNNVWWRYTLHQIKQSLCISLACSTRCSNQEPVFRQTREILGDNGVFRRDQIWTLWMAQYTPCLEFKRHSISPQN